MRRSRSFSSTFLSTPSLGITFDVNENNVTFSTAKDFQLPLSGSPAAAGSTTPTRLHISFNSLSRDHLAKRKSTTIDVDSHFQLPLSGSPASSYHFLHPKTSKTAFNSLSRDHLKYFISELQARNKSFNSLSRDHNNVDDDVEAAIQHVAFNSLSRDHLNRLIDEMSRSEIKAFNSLSRDH